MSETRFDKLSEDGKIWTGLSLVVMFVASAIFSFCVYKETDNYIAGSSIFITLAGILVSVVYHVGIKEVDK